MHVAKISAHYGLLVEVPPFDDETIRVEHAQLAELQITERWTQVPLVVFTAPLLRRAIFNPVIRPKLAPSIHICWLVDAS